tara:strand:- start:2296 stop:2661 length:366 start_codon:yes stop_codon:yes gene_type:complete
MKKGLYHNIQQKRKRIAAGSGEKMRKPGAKGAPSAQNFKDADKTAKKMRRGGKVPPKLKGFSKLPESVQEKIDPEKAKKYNMGGMTMSDKMNFPMNNTMGSPMGMMNKGYARGGGIRKVKY